MAFEFFEDDFLDLLIEEEVIADSYLSNRPVHGGSLPGKRANLPQDFEATHTQIYSDIFSENPLYTDSMFERRFRMPRSLFQRIMHDILEFDPWF